ncbi:MAG: DUF6900 domain-containing protein [Thermoguttaceae bacterium]
MTTPKTMEEARELARQERNAEIAARFPDKENLVRYIATQMMSFETTETRNWDSLDFKEVAIWTLIDALDIAYRAGQNSVRKQK